MHVYNLQDGQWHMVTLTTLPGTAGFAMYLDGALAGEFNTTTGAACPPCPDQIATASSLYNALFKRTQRSLLFVTHQAGKSTLWMSQFWPLASCPWMAATP